MIPVYIPPCIYCRNMYRGEKILCCYAYPDGIPYEIRTNKIDSRAFSECGKGYRFEDKRIQKNC